MSNYGLNTYASNGALEFSTNRLGYFLMDSIEVLAGVSGSKTYADNGRILQAISIPVGNNDVFEHGGHLVSVSGLTVTWTSYSIQGPAPNTCNSVIVVFGK